VFVVVFFENVDEPFSQIESTLPLLSTRAFGGPQERSSGVMQVPSGRAI
jgi:hypothetical protein